MFVADHVERYEKIPYSYSATWAWTPPAGAGPSGPDQDSMAENDPAGSTVLLDRTPVREVTARGIYAVREDVGGEPGCTIKRLVVTRTPEC